MFRTFVVAFVVSWFVTSAWAQAQPVAPGPAASAGAKPAAKRPAAKSQAGAKPAPPADSGPCQVGVISAIGDQFVVQKIGFTVFSNERTEVPVGNWGLNDLVVARVRAAAGPGVAVRRIAHTSAAIEPSSFVRKAAARSHCQRYVLVHSSTSQFSNLNQSVRGVGIVNWGNPIKDHTYLFALTYIQIYDGQGFDVITQGAASTDDESMVSRALMLKPIRGPNRELDNTSFPSAPVEAATSSALRDGVRALLTASLDKTLPAMLRQ